MKNKRLNKDKPAHDPDEVLRHMLSTPPQPHKPKTKKKASKPKK